MNKETTTKTFNYKSQYGVVVVCESETHQQDVFEKLAKMNLKLKIVCV
jgi:hypothetical protein